MTVRFFQNAALLIMALSQLASEPATASELKLWTRSPGNYTDGEHHEPKEVKLYDLKKHSEEKTLFDLQYKHKVRVDGVPLAKIIRSYQAKSREDLALLHFDNGMVIPLPFRNQKQMKKLDLFVARRVKVDGKWRDQFDDVAKPNDRYRDPNPIRFKSIKLIASDLWHPNIKIDPTTSEKDRFSPWRHMDSLVGIEFVNEEAYYKQFLPLKSPTLDHKVGLKVFKNRCQYCHGVRLVGSKFGWDYVNPYPIYKHKHPVHIYQKVKLNFHDAFERGLLMPEQKDVKKGEIYAMWGWLKMLGRQKDLRSYAP